MTWEVDDCGLNDGELARSLETSTGNVSVTAESLRWTGAAGFVILVSTFGGAIVFIDFLS